MKRKIMVFGVLACFLVIGWPSRAQRPELEQLILNIEKLNQLRAILDNMYKGYEILTNGYNTIKGLAEGNFDLHKVFLDGLLEVSPTVKKYKKVGEIIRIQQQLVKEYKSAYQRFKSLQVFNQKDIDYFGNVYENLMERSLNNLDELIMIVTARKMRMNDAERLSAIDRIYSDMLDKLQFLRQFNNKTALVAAQRRKMANENEDIQDVYGIKK